MFSMQHGNIAIGDTPFVIAVGPDLMGGAVCNTVGMQHGNIAVGDMPFVIAVGPDLMGGNML